MTATPSWSRRALGAVCLAALVAAPAACGADDDAGSDAAPATTTTTAAPATCGERLLELSRREDVVEAARTDADELPAEAQAAFDAFDADCSDELEALPDAESEALIAQIDPDVVDYLGAGTTQEFEQTGESIGSASD